MYSTLQTQVCCCIYLYHRSMLLTTYRYNYIAKLNKKPHLFSGDNNVRVSNNQMMVEDPYEPVFDSTENATPSRLEGKENTVHSEPHYEVPTTPPELPQEKHSDDDPESRIRENGGPLGMPTKVDELASPVRNMKGESSDTYIYIYIYIM